MRRYWTMRSRVGSALLKGSVILLCLVLLAPSTFSGLADSELSRQDGNDTFDTAQKAENKVQVIGDLDVVNDPVDFFWIRASVGEVVDAHFIILQPFYNFSNPEEVDFDLEIYNPIDRNKPVTTSKTTDQFEIESLVAPIDGKYYFKIQAVNGSGEYAFMVTVYDPPEMEEGGIYSGYVKQNSNNDADWYKVDLKGGNPAEAVRCTLTHDATGNLDLFLMDLWSTRPYWLNLSWFQGPPTEEVFGVAAYSGYYYLKVHAYSGYGNYQLKSFITEVPTDNDNSKSSARFLEYNTTRYDSVDQGEDKYDFFEARLQPQENISLKLTLLDNHRDIYSLFLLDVDLNVMWEKTNYVFEPQHGTTDVVEFSYIVDGGVYFVVVMAKVALKDNPDDLSDETAAADYELVVKMSKHAEKPPNRLPIIKPGKDNTTFPMNEDTVEYLDLNDYFEDPDGDQMFFNASGYTNLSVSVDLGGTVTILPFLDWCGDTEINFTAQDFRVNPKTWTLLKVTVKCTPEPPIITDYGPARTFGMGEGEEQEFFVTVIDEDSPEVFYNWSLDGAHQSGGSGNFTYRPGFDDAGIHTIRVEVTDGQAEVKWDWSVTVANINRAPVIVSVSPENGTKFGFKERVDLGAVIMDPDGDILSFSWREGVQLIAQGTNVTPNVNHSFAPGKHNVVLQVSDTSGKTVTTEIVFEVEEEERGFDWGYIAAVVIVLVVLVAIFLAYIIGSGKVDREERERLVEEEIEKERRRRSGGKKGLKKKRKRKRKRKGRKGTKGKVRSKVKEEIDDDLSEEIEKEVRSERERMKKRRKG